MQEMTTIRTGIIKSKHIHRRRIVKQRKDKQPDMGNVNLAINGHLVKLYPNELFIAVKILTEQNRSTAEIATMLGCCCRTVTRHRARMRKFKELKDAEMSKMSEDVEI